MNGSRSPLSRLGFALRHTWTPPRPRPGTPGPLTGYDVVKRAMDLTAAGCGLVMLGPVLGTVALLVRRKLGSPVLFSAQRPGLHGELFTMFKFRSMTDERGPDGQLLPDADRLTPFGAMLRSTSLDELPELFNVLRGDISLVGPRPLPKQYLDRYSPRQAQRHLVPPGITGWTQVNGRNALSWEEKFDLDLWYVEHRSLGLDALILWKTLTVVFNREGVSAEGEATMPEFMGTEGE